MENGKQPHRPRVPGDGVYCGKCGHLLAGANSLANPRSSARAFIEAVEAHRCSSAPSRRAHA